MPVIAGELDYRRPSRLPAARRVIARHRHLENGFAVVLIAEAYRGLRADIHVIGSGLHPRIAGLEREWDLGLQGLGRSGGRSNGKSGSRDRQIQSQAFHFSTSIGFDLAFPSTR